MLKRALLVLILLLIPSLAQAGVITDHNCIPLVEPNALAFTARVVEVENGDIITVEPVDSGKYIEIRLYGIDCPKENQPYGSIAKNYITYLTLDKIVKIEEKDKDQYGRTVAIVTLGNGNVLQELLLEDGFAWVYPSYCKDCKSWMVLQAEAMTAKAGLWQDLDPTPPWMWRKKR